MAPKTSSETSWIKALLPFKMAEGAATPAIPLVGAMLGGSALAIGFMEFLFSMFTMLGGYVWGRTSDETRKRKAFLVLALFLGAGSVVGIGLAPHFGALMGWRALMGFALAGIMSVGGALIADQTRLEELGAKLGRFTAVGGLGYALGLVVAAFLLWDKVGIPLQPVLLLVGAFAILSSLLAFVLIRESLSHLVREDVHRLLSNLFDPVMMPVRSRAFSWGGADASRERSHTEQRAWTYLGSTFLHFLATGSVMVLLPLYIVELGSSEMVVFLVFIVHSGVAAAAFAPLGSAGDKIGFRTTQLSALTLRGLAFAALALPFLRSSLAVAGVMVLVGVTFGALQATGPAALLREMAIRDRGELNGFYRIASAFGLAVGGLVAGIVVEFVGFPELFVTAASLTAVAGVLTAVIVYPKDRDQVTSTPSPAAT